MKKILTLLVVASAALTHAYGQNLLTNPDFENKSACPTDLSSSSTGGYHLPLLVTGWYQGTGGSSDYYNQCDTAGLHPAGIPKNFFGYQHAYSGNAYMGVYAHITGYPHYREYIMSRIPPLQPGATYVVAARVSLSDGSHFAVDGIGALFTTYGSPDTATQDELLQVPQASFNSYGILSDTAHWKSVIDTFVADSAYTTVIFGDFNTAASIHIDSLPVAFYSMYDYAYYYVDSVSLVKIKPPLSAGNVGNNAYNVRIHPNPFSDRAQLTFDDLNGKPAELAIFNSMGRIMLVLRGIEQGKAVIERNDLPAGLYFYRLSNEGGTIGTGRFSIN